jgi:hypothetical protein
MLSGSACPGAYLLHLSKQHLLICVLRSADRSFDMFVLGRHVRNFWLRLASFRHRIEIAYVAKVEVTHHPERKSVKLSRDLFQLGLDQAGIRSFPHRMSAVWWKECVEQLTTFGRIKTEAYLMQSISN